ncbi:MAG: hypothetical protein AB7F43_06645 [Bacteriovoracia bacterium]
MFDLRKVCPFVAVGLGACLYSAHATDFTGLGLRLNALSNVYSSSYLKDSNTRRVSVFGNADNADNYPFEYGVAVGPSLSLPGGLYLTLQASALFMSSSASETTKSELSTLISNLTFLPLYEYKVTASASTDIYMGILGIGHYWILGEDTLIRLLLRGGFGKASYKESVKISGLTSSTSEVEYEYQGYGFAYQSDLGVEFRLQRFTFGAFYGYRVFKMGKIPVHVVKGSAGSNSVDVNLNSQYAGVQIGVEL